MPVQMRHHIAKTGQIDFMGLEVTADYGLNREYHVHQGMTLIG